MGSAFGDGRAISLHTVGSGQNARQSAGGLEEASLTRCVLREATRPRALAGKRFGAAETRDGVHERDTDRAQRVCGGLQNRTRRRSYIDEIVDLDEGRRQSVAVFVWELVRDSGRRHFWRLRGGGGGCRSRLERIKTAHSVASTSVSRPSADTHLHRLSRGFLRGTKG